MQHKDRLNDGYKLAAAYFEDTVTSAAYFRERYREICSLGYFRDGSHRCSIVCFVGSFVASVYHIFLNLSIP